MNIFKGTLLAGFILLTATLARATAPADSLRTEVIEGKSYIIHKVEAKETAYSLARRYNVAVSEIFKENPESKNGLNIDQLVKIPVTKTTSAAAPDKKPEPAAAAKIHTVQAGQTLYAVSRLYKVSVEDIKKWNNLTGDALAEGQELIVSNGGEDKKPEKKKDPKPEPKDDKKKDPKPEPAQVPAKNPEPIKKTAMNAGGFENVVETGIAELIDEKDESKKFLALHPTAPYGTILQVTNEQNGLYVFVRVIGKLPDIPTNKNLTVKISKGAWDKLACVDKRFMVKVEYTP